MGITSPFASTGALYLGNPVGISAYAADRTAATNAYIAQLGLLSASLGAPVIDPIFPTGPSAPTPLLSEVPTTAEILWVAPSIPAEFTATLDTGNFLPEAFDESPPELLFGSEPATFVTAVPDAPGIDLQFVYPDLVLNLPAAPSLLSLSISNFAGVSLPTLDTTLPELTAVAPEVREYVPGAQYTSALLTAMQTTLLERITSGGTGLAPDVENALWDRGREREARSAQDATLELERMEALGYTFPPGIYLDARLKIATETDYANRGHSREVMIEAARLEQENVKHSLTTATQLEGQLISYTNSVEQRLFDSCRYATEAGVSIYNAKVQGYVALVDAYKTKIAIYEAQIRGEIAKVDVYKAQIDAEMAKASINRTLVDQYKIQTDVALSAIEVFKAEIGAIQAKADIEKLKVETFGVQVQAYNAQVNAYTAGVEGFRAKIQAEASKQDAYKSRVQAFVAQVEAGGKQIDARIAEYRARLDAYTTRWEGYKAAAQAEASRVQSLASSNSSIAEIYKAEVSGLTGYNEVLTKQWQVVLDQGQRVSEIAVNAAKANAELYITTRSLAIEAAKVGAQVSAQLGAAALNAINWSTSYSASDSFGNSYSQSFSESTSDSTSVSTNYNYSV